MTITAETALSEKAIQNLEALIPDLAAAATRAAYNRALASGHAVLRVEGCQIVAVTAEGITRVVGEVAPRRKVSVGEAITVCRRSTFTSD